VQTIVEAVRRGLPRGPLSIHHRRTAAPEWVETAIATGWGGGLSADQAEAVRGVLSSKADLNVVIGPAGTGKTTAD
jgi:AAA domain